ncbi:MAG: MASE1 domain-containing protein, partial [Hyphomicrobiales bacterium]|nr:MASE1 domain-containing protein [Hyphomicrobiales bacterium]
MTWTTIQGAGPPVWPAAGVGFAGLLLGGIVLWPAIFIGGLVAAILGGPALPLWAHVLIALGNALSTVAGVYFLRRYPIELAFSSLASMIRYLFFCAFLGSLLAALAGVATLFLSSDLSLHSAFANFILWLAGAFSGAAIVGPLILSWLIGSFRREPPLLFFILTVTAIVSWLLFLLPGDPLVRSWHLLPVLIWAALAFQVRGATAALFISTSIAVAGFTSGVSPYDVVNMNAAEHAPLLQQFLAISAMTVLCLASLDEERYASGEQKLRATLDAARMGVFEIALNSGTASLDTRSRRLLGLDPNGRPISVHRLMQMMRPSDRIMAIDALRKASQQEDGGENIGLEFAVRTPDDEQRWLAIRSAVEFDGLPHMRKPVAVRGTIRDVTRRRLAQQEVSRLASIIDNSPDFVGIARNGGVIFINSAGRKLIGIDDDTDLSDRPINSFYSQHARLLLEDVAIPVAIKNGSWTGENEIIGSDGKAIAIHQTILAHRDDAGELQFISTIIRDMTEQKANEAHQRLMLRELSHRVKNMMAVVHSIARQSAATVSDPARFTETFLGRLASLGASHGLLTASDWRGASVDRIIRKQLEHLGSPDATGGVVIDGPHVLLNPEDATNLGLAVHEMATNAAVHGAFSRSGGSITVRWEIEGDVLKLKWQEENKAMDF